MYVRERQRGGEAAHNDVRESSSESEERLQRNNSRGRRGGSMRSRRHELVAEAPASLVTRAVGSVVKLVRVAEFEILFVLFFVLAVLLFKDLTARPEYNQILVQRRFEEQTRLY